MAAAVDRPRGFALGRATHAVGSPTMDRRLLSSRAIGWLADLRLPKFARVTAWRAFARIVGADLDEMEHPLADHASLTDFFIRRLRTGLRPVDSRPTALVSPVDGRVQSIDVVGAAGDVFQAKNQPYRAAELLGPLAPENLVGWRVWTLYLSPKDYHRIHSPWDGSLDAVAWIGGERFSVAPRVLERRPRVFVRNARAVLRFDCGGRRQYAVFVGALNVSRIFVERVAADSSPRSPIPFARGAEIGRFELGSTVILVTPPDGALPLAELSAGSSVRMGTAIGHLHR